MIFVIAVPSLWFTFFLKEQHLRVCRVPGKSRSRDEPNGRDVAQAVAD